MYSPSQQPFYPVMQQMQVSYIPSIQVDYNAYAESDALLLKKCFDGIGCDEQTILNIITHRNSAQREQIKSAYQAKFGKSLIDRAISELYDPLEYLVLCLLYTGPDADAFILKRATKGLSTHDEILIHILVTRSSYQISKISESYLNMYKKTLIADVRGDTSGNYKKLLCALIETPRAENEYDINKAKMQCTEIYSRPSLLKCISHSFIPIFAQSSYAQIRLIGDEFRKQFGESLAKYLENFIGNYEKTLSSIYLFSCNPHAYFASFLRQRILNIDIKGVICLIATRCEIDLASILNEYYKLYGSRPEHDIKNAFATYPHMVITALNMLLGFK